MEKPIGTNRILQSNHDLHKMLHESIHHAGMKILMADVELTITEKIIAEETEEHDEEGKEYGKILQAIANLDRVQAVERKKFYKDLHDRYFPDAEELAD